jgi:hypothetical protein
MKAGNKPDTSQSQALNDGDKACYFRLQPPHINGGGRGVSWFQAIIQQRYSVQFD